MFALVVGGHAQQSAHPQRTLLMFESPADPKQEDASCSSRAESLQKSAPSQPLFSIGPNPRSLWLEFNHNCDKHNEKNCYGIREKELTTTCQTAQL
jgi:hypothetical protein